ncbi:SGNH/GDSL hydrolase family protein [Pseudolysinimonas sp.]|uniref:SGNH/GDSL hydrolase family protein n=1 Tax=Pseudolysinimonas sp. TaxID=2680009 RepID=UPI00286CCBD3|nr:SGNH/GDSL hydrolase family protein [Pseudolysinimonas sp.]
MTRALAVVLAPIVLAQAARLRRTTPLLPAPEGERVGGKGKLRLVVVGDSTAVGTGAESLDDALPGRLGKLLGARWRVVGRNGATAADVLRDHVDEAAGGPADVAVLMVGWNDALKLRSDRAFARDLGSLIDRLVAASPKGRVVVVGPPVFANFAVLPRPLRNALGAHAAGLARVSARVAADREVDFAPGFDGQSVSSDGFHPDRRGYKSIAAGIVATLAS